MLYLLYAILVVGAVGLFLAVPGGRVATARAGGLGLAAAGLGLITILARVYVGGAPALPLYVCAFIAFAAAARVVTHRKPVYSALYFVLLVVAVAGLLVLVQAEFLAAALVIVYAGAILVTYLFVIMLAQQARAAAYDAQAREPFWGVLGGFVLLGAITSEFCIRPVMFSAPPDAAGTVEAVGLPLLTQYVVALQLTGVLLLAAMIGAIAVARRPVALPTAEEEG
jgi:NADH-quinone oxidoreductase subunit J